MSETYGGTAAAQAVVMLELFTFLNVLGAFMAEAYVLRLVGRGSSRPMPWPDFDRSTSSQEGSTP